ncbi:MAG: hypothetical protein ABSH35_15630 [Isosphaeraceae bacterium]
MPLSQAVVLQGTTAVGFLLQDDRVDKLTSFHATQRQQPVGPGVSRLADEFGDGVGPLDARLLPQLQVGVNDLSGQTIFRGQMTKFIDGHGRTVAAHADRGQPLLQVARLPFAGVVVPPLQQVA